jgi:hypothetical protein
LITDLDFMNPNKNRPKWCPYSVIAPLLGAVLLPTVYSATFESGSTGSYGPLNITTSTALQLPPDGVFHCTTINVAPGATLTFKKNELNTPAYLLATGDIQVSGTIDVSAEAFLSNDHPAGGVGGVGGFDGGPSGTQFNTSGGDGLGPGGGKAGGYLGAAHAFVPGTSPANTNRYGSPLLEPLIGGSGGAGPDYAAGPTGGSGGGGAILLASSTSIQVNGAILAKAYEAGNWGGGGSGGAIRLVAPTISGAGRLDTEAYPNGGTRTASAGRVRLDCLDDASFVHLTIIGSKTRGSRMIVFPANAPGLDILSAAGQQIPEGSGNTFRVDLPANAPLTQSITVQARNFTGIVPIIVKVIPAHGPATTYPAQIDMSSGNPARTDVTITLPAGMKNEIQVWTR